MRNLHKRILKEKDEFAQASVCALAVGIGSTIAIGTDMAWLIGDMSIQTHPHHYYILIGLTIAQIITVASFVWLYRSMNRFLIKKIKERRMAHERIKIRNLTPHFCGQTNKDKINHLKDVYEFED